MAKRERKWETYPSVHWLPSMSCVSLLKKAMGFFDLMNYSFKTAQFQ
jgi:hypothetical protein